jgi:shikimate kinase
VSPPAVGEGPAARVVLLGLMGSGKTTMGKALAARLGWRLLDSDVQLERSTGLTARRFREAHGTTALHRAEAAALLEALGGPGPAIIGAAASTIEDPAARSAIGGPGIIPVWLRASPAVLAARFGRKAHRPIYGADPEAVAREQARVRDPLFAALDPIVIDVDDRSPAESVEAALDAIRERLGRSSPGD